MLVSEGQHRGHAAVILTEIKLWVCVLVSFGVRLKDCHSRWKILVWLFRWYNYGERYLKIQSIKGRLQFQKSGGFLLWRFRGSKEISLYEVRLRLVRSEIGHLGWIKSDQQVTKIDSISDFGGMVKVCFGINLRDNDISANQLDFMWRFRINQGSRSSMRWGNNGSSTEYICGVLGMRQNHSISFKFLSFGFFFLLSYHCLGSFSVSMSQSQFLNKGGVEGSWGSQGVGNLKMKIKIPYFDNSALIAGYSKTVIGRCMNPRVQDMKSLLFMFPRIWQLEGRVAGADLGSGRFQFDFDHEEDIVEVLKMEPFHFDYWMVSMVRWKPSVDPSYPSLIRFWIRMLDIPIEYWAEPTFRGVGEALGSDVVVDIDGGRIQVTLDGFKPLVFESFLEFGGGEETRVKFRYERLFGFCKICHSLRHESSICPQVIGEGSGDNHDPSMDDGEGKHVFSYKAAVIHEKKNMGSAEGKQGGDPKGKAPMGGYVAEGKKYSKGYGNGGTRDRTGKTKGEVSFKPRRFTSYAQTNNSWSVRADQMGQQRQDNEAVDEVVSQEPVGAMAEIAKNENGKSKVQKALLFQGKQQLVFEDEQMVQAQHETVMSGEVVSAATSGSYEEAAKMVRVEELVPVSEAHELETHEETRESFSSLLADVEASLPLGGIPEEGEIFADQFLTEHFDSSDNIGTNQFTDLSLLDVDFSEIEVMGESVDNVVIKGNNVTEVELEKGNGKNHVEGKKKVVKGGVLALQGVSTRKRNVQIFTTPRKRSSAKTGTEPRLGDGSNPPNQGTKKGGEEGTNLQIKMLRR